MSDLFKGILENYAGEEAIGCLSSLCNATIGFLEPEDVNLYDLTDCEIEKEFIWAIQQKFEMDYCLLDYLVGAENSDTEYSEIIDYIYLEYDLYTRSFRFDEEMLPEIFGEDLLEDYEDSLNQFIDGINRGTTLKVLNINGNHTA